MSLRQTLRTYKLNLQHAAEDLTAPGAARKAWFHFMVFDHGFLRVLWTNFDQIAPDVFRANQPSPRRVAQYAQRGIKTLINLRGPSDAPHHTFERAACAELGVTLVDISGLVARKAPAREDLLATLDALRQAEKPMLLHCKSGADRTSLAAALYLLAIENAPVSVARKQFSTRYIHLKWTKTGVLDHILDTYEAAQSATAIEFEDWLRTDYDADAIQTQFEASRS